MKNKNIYKGLECHCNDFEKIPINRRNLGIAGDIAPYAFAIGEGYTIYKLGNYLKNEKVSKGIRNIPKIYIKMNGGLSSFFQAIIEGKSGERALTEAGVSVGSGIFADEIFNSKLLTQTIKLASSGATRLTTSKMASNIAVKTGVSLLTRIATGAATGAAVGSAFPIVGTIIGAVAGTLIAGAINDAIFEDEDKKLEDDKAYNAEIEKQAEQYHLKINQINEYLTNHHYIELRELDEIEAENLCKEASNLQSHYFKTIELMLSYKDYLSNQQSKSHTTDSTPTQPNTESTQSTTPTTKSPQQAKDSNNANNNNPNTKNTNTFPFQLQIKDYNTFAPLSNKQIQLTNIDSKQIYTQTTIKSK